MVAHQSANASFEHGATTRFAVANAIYVPTVAAASLRRGTTASITPATSRRSSTDHTAATSPKLLCWERTGSPGEAPANFAVTSTALPKYC